MLLLAPVLFALVRSTELNFPQASLTLEQKRMQTISRWEDSLSGTKFVSCFPVFEGLYLTLD